MKYKRHTIYYFVNKTTKALDSLRVIDIAEGGFVYLYNGAYKFCSYKNAEGKLYESDLDPELLSKLGMCRQSCYYDFTHRCNRHHRLSPHCPCPMFIHRSDSKAESKYLAMKAKAEKAQEVFDIEAYPFGDR